MRAVQRSDSPTPAFRYVMRKFQYNAASRKNYSLKSQKREIPLPEETASSSDVRV